MKTRRILVVLLAITLCLTSCATQNIVITHQNGSADSSTSAAFSVPQSESVGASSAVMDNSRSESVAFSSTSASESTGPQSKTAEEPPFWADKACAPVTFAEDPAGCISYAIWLQVEEHLEYIENRKIAPDKKQEKLQSQLERADPIIIASAGLADLNQDGVPELFLNALAGWILGISVYDVSEQEPAFVTRIAGGGRYFSIDYVYNETNDFIARISSCYGHGMYDYDYLTFFEKQIDRSWDIWECETERTGWKKEESVVTGTRVAHNLQQVDDPDDSLYNQLVSRSVAQPQVPYVELDEMDVYNETLSTGEDWWIAYGRMLWDEYQQALQQTETVG